MAKKIILKSFLITIFILLNLSFNVIAEICGEYCKDYDIGSCVIPTLYTNIRGGGVVVNNACYYRPVGVSASGDWECGSTCYCYDVIEVDKNLCCNFLYEPIGGKVGVDDLYFSSCDDVDLQSFCLSCGGSIWLSTGTGTNSKCCGDDGLNDDWCSGGYTSCYNGDYYSNGDNNQYTCECGISGTQGTCTSGETGCWDTSSAACCGDDPGEDWCAGGYTACVDGYFRTSADSYSYVCTCGGGIWMGSSCCGNNGNEKYVNSYCPGYYGPAKCCESDKNYIDSSGNCIVSCPSTTTISTTTTSGDIYTTTTTTTLTQPSTTTTTLTQPSTTTTTLTQPSTTTPSTTTTTLEDIYEMSPSEKITETTVELQEPELPTTEKATEKFDCRNIMSSIKDQGNCGSCWAHAGAGAMEATIKKTSGNEMDLSEADIICKNLPGIIPNRFCRGGNFRYLDISKGVVDEFCRPYDTSLGCTNPCENPDTRTWKINNIDEFSIGESESKVEKLKKILNSKCPLVTNLEFPAGGHQVLLIGYDDDSEECRQAYDQPGCFIFKNSWGASTGWISAIWHEAGYAYIPYYVEPERVIIKSPVLYINGVTAPPLIIPDIPNPDPVTDHCGNGIFEPQLGEVCDRRLGVKNRCEPYDENDPFSEGINCYKICDGPISEQIYKCKFDCSGYKVEKKKNIGVCHPDCGVLQVQIECRYEKPGDKGRCPKGQTCTEACGCSGGGGTDLPLIWFGLYDGSACTQDECKSVQGPNILECGSCICEGESCPDCCCCDDSRCEGSWNSWCEMCCDTIPVPSICNSRSSSCEYCLQGDWGTVPSCGWCTDTGECKLGDASGSYDYECSDTGGNWAWDTYNECSTTTTTTTTILPQFSECGNCELLGVGCPRQGECRVVNDYSVCEREEQFNHDGSVKVPCCLWDTEGCTGGYQNRIRVNIDGTEHQIGDLITIEVYQEPDNSESSSCYYDGIDVKLNNLGGVLLPPDFIVCRAENFKNKNAENECDFGGDNGRCRTCIWDTNNIQAAADSRAIEFPVRQYPVGEHGYYTVNVYYGGHGDTGCNDASDSASDDTTLLGESVIYFDPSEDCSPGTQKIEVPITVVDPKFNSLEGWNIEQGNPVVGGDISSCNYRSRGDNCDEWGHCGEIHSFDGSFLRDSNNNDPHEYTISTTIMIPQEYVGDEYLISVVGTGLKMERAGHSGTDIGKSQPFMKLISGEFSTKYYLIGGECEWSNGIFKIQTGNPEIKIYLQSRTTDSSHITNVMQAGFDDLKLYHCVPLSQGSITKTSITNLR